MGVLCFNGGGGGCFSDGGGASFLSEGGRHRFGVGSRGGSKKIVIWGVLPCPAPTMGNPDTRR